MSKTGVLVLGFIVSGLWCGTALAVELVSREAGSDLGWKKPSTIYTLAAKKKKKGGGGYTGPTSTGLKININTAKPSELDVLPLVDPALAAEIVEYREENGPFSKPEDIINVPGIGLQKYRVFKNLIVVE